MYPVAYRASLLSDASSGAKPKRILVLGREALGNLQS